MAPSRVGGTAYDATVPPPDGGGTVAPRVRANRPGPVDHTAFGYLIEVQPDELPPATEAAATSASHAAPL